MFELYTDGKIYYFTIEGGMKEGMSYELRACGPSLYVNGERARLVRIKNHG